MTLAHKTPGAIVGLRNDEATRACYPLDELEDLFEVEGEGPGSPGHVAVKRLRDGSRFLLHDEVLVCKVAAGTAERLRRQTPGMSAEHWDDVVRNKGRHPGAPRP